MKKRITLQSPRYDHDFQVINGNLRKHFCWWYFQTDWQTLEELALLKMDVSSPKLDEVLRLAGSHATLWIDNWQGTIAPMDQPPQNWQYPSGTKLEPEWWWQWYPNHEAEKQALEFLNINPFEAWDATSPIKYGVPFQFQRKMGDVIEVNAIDLQRLPHLLKKQTKWTFEWES